MSPDGRKALKITTALPRAIMDDAEPVSASRAVATSALRLRPSMTPLGPRGRTRSSAAMDSAAASPTISRGNTPDIPPPSPNPESARPVADTAPPAVKPIIKAQPVTVPPPISFETVPIQWKGLPLEAALWTFTSQELQHIVSRSIRSSADESSIRLLSAENSDTVLPAEMERLEIAKLTTQSKYRFLVQRRTMLLQAINSRATAPVSARDAKDGDDPSAVIVSLTVQLSQVAAECDQQVVELVKIYDQQAQISKMMDVHWGSTLAVALRKLNGSYGKRTVELNKAREKVSQLEAQLEDAWKEAERLAQEMDTYDAAMGSDGEDQVVISKAAVVSVPQSPRKEANIPLPMVPTYFTVEALSRDGSKIALTHAPSPNDSPPRYPDYRQTVPSEITPTLSREPSDSPSSHDPLKKTYTETSGSAKSSEDEPAFPPRNERILPLKNGCTSLPAPPPNDAIDGDTIDDAVSIKSNRSNKSTRSVKSRVSAVSAARRRSNRVSENSLRFTHQQKSSFSKPKNAPPVPTLPLLRKRSESNKSNKSNRFSTSLLSTKSFKFYTNTSPSPTSPSNKRSQSSGTTSSTSPRSSSSVTNPKEDKLPQDIVLDIRRRTSLEDLHVIESPTSAEFGDNNTGVTADDIYVHPRRGAIGDPTTRDHMSTDDLNHANGQEQSQGMPSLWNSGDAPTTPAERVQNLLSRGSKRNPYSKLKTLTKRYSLPFPLFNTNSKSSTSESRTRPRRVS